MVTKFGGFAVVGGSICLLVLLCITFQNENFKYSLLNPAADAIEHTQAAAGNKAALLKKMRSLLQDKIDNQHMIGSKVQALIAASALKQRQPGASVKDPASFQALAQALVAKHWKAMRADWKPFDPTMSLLQNRAADPAADPWGSRADELRGARPLPPSELP
eukprot:CAMPEP_0172187632 /NCGR_PEP_ID=MMETSP1050-20130122/21452_1 /TAXON_ID=233186 /ORGANISM="Cryptomonas curvata, Strain CCAP979/52" /LENGTH=161 /DNA_ID=CAMNT_0012861989 /DNA_START=12 /DNA_END=493 /DNA_ORIENTATION=-